MADNLRRKCFKCGLSPGVDSDIKLYRFPKPGTTNIRRCEAWAKFCFPDSPWSSPEFQFQLYKEHRMLCNKHFKKSEFLNLSEKKLCKHAVPDTDDNKPLAISLRSDTCVENIPSVHSEDNETVSRPSSSGILIDKTNKQHEKALAISQSDACVGNIPPIHSEDYTTVSLPSSSGILIEKTNKQHEKALVISQSDACVENIPPVHSEDYRTVSRPSSSGILIEKTNKQHEKIGPVYKPALSEPVMKKNEENVLYKKCRANLKKIWQLKKRIKNLKNANMLNTIIDNKAVGNLMKHITPAFALMLQAQLKNTQRKYKGRRWSFDDKIICLRMYKRSATCYRLLRRLWCLPAPSTLKSVLRRFNLQAGLNDRIFNSLKKHIKAQESLDKEYVLMFDEMAIRKHIWYNIKEDRVDGYQDHGKHGRSPQEATYALVFMVAGIRKKTKQPVAFYLSSAYVTADRLAVLIKEVLQKCFSIGMSISATVCDMGGVNRRALNILGASMDNPYFNYQNNEVVTIFDPPHLLKCFRNLFLKYDIKCDANITSNNIKGQGIAKWKHIQDFYEIDNSHPNFVYAPKLKKEHIAPNNKQKMRVYLAAQVLSHSVAGGMFARITEGLLTTEAAITADVIKNMDKLFDCVNSNSADRKRGKPHSTNLTDESPHLKLFEEMKEFFKKMEFVGCISSPPSKQGWIWTLNGISRIFRNLKKKHNIKALSTRRLQQDPLENLFGTIRANCGANCNPNTGQFIGGLKTAMLSNLAHMGSGSGNCESDDCESVLKNYKQILYSTPNTIYTEKEPISSHVTDMISSIDNNIFDESLTDSGELQACAYVCGFLLKNFKNNCTVCQEILKSKNKDDVLYNFMHFKEYDEIKKNLKYASEDFVKCVERCATLCNNFFSVSSHSLYLKENTKKILLQNVNFSFLRKCEVHFSDNISFITNSVFHITIKRFCTLNNRKFVEAASTTGLKRKMDIIKHI